MLQRIHANPPQHTFQELLNYIVINDGLRISTRGILFNHNIITKRKQNEISSLHNILRALTVSWSVVILHNNW